MIGTPKGSKHFNPVFLGSGRNVLTSSRRQYWNMLLLHDKAIHHPLKIWGAFHLHPSTLYPLSLVTSLCLKHAWSFFMSPRLCSLRIGRQRQRQQRRRGGTLSVSENSEEAGDEGSVNAAAASLLFATDGDNSNKLYAKFFSRDDNLILGFSWVFSSAPNALTDTVSTASALDCCKQVGPLNVTQEFGTKVVRARIQAVQEGMTSCSRNNFLLHLYKWSQHPDNNE